MPPRTSARSGAKPSSQAAQKSPPRRSRVTRSQSVELGQVQDEGRVAARAAREASVDSTKSAKSNSTTDPIRPGQPKRITRAAAASGLPSVREDMNSDGDAQSAVGEEDDQDNGAAGDQAEDEDSGKAEEPSQDLVRSPGGMSQISGTTAISKTHSVREIAELDPMIADLLPDLLGSSCEILDLLAPEHASEEAVDSIVKDLRTFGSRRAKRLKYVEEKFRLTRDNYGSDVYITTKFINRRLLGTAEPEEGDFRPDAIIHAANLATLVKEILVTERESRAMHAKMWELDVNFPTPFLTRFDDRPPQFGSSSMEPQTFDMALEIRTMYAIADLYYQKDSETWQPDQLLAQYFFESPTGSIEELMKEGQLRNIMREGPSATEDQATTIIARISNIRDTFRDNQDEAEAGDLVDFEQLEERFPWSTFLTNLVHWSRTRLGEIHESIRKQGGIAIITELLQEKFLSDSQGEFKDEPPLFVEPRQLLPAADIVTGTSEKSFYTNKEMIRLMRNLGKPAPSPNSGASTLPMARPIPRHETSHEPIQPPVRSAADEQEDDWQIAMTDDDDVQLAPGSRPTVEYVQAWEKATQYKNKENKRPTQEERRPASKTRLLDRQANATEVSWDTQDSAAESYSRKRPRTDEAHEEVDESSQDEGFQNDQVSPDPARRLAAPLARNRTPIRTASAKRPRVDRTRSHSIDSDRAYQEQAQTELQASAYQFNNEYLDVPTPTFTQVKVSAKVAAVRAKSGVQEPQTRTPWTDHDEQLLLSLIEQYGCSWATIAKCPNWEIERPNFQVQCKDKARNMKVAFLKAQMDLPINFEYVSLGKKEIAMVRKVRPEYQP